MRALGPKGARTQLARSACPTTLRRATTTTPRAQGPGSNGAPAPPKSDKERQPWEFSRFLKTVFYFNPPSELAWSAATAPLRMLGIGAAPAPAPSSPVAPAPAGATLPVYIPGDPKSPVRDFAALDDVVMGGASASGLSVRQGAGEDGAAPAGVFAGFVTTANNGGFASVRTRNLTPPLDLGAYDGLVLRVLGNGLRFKFVIKTDDGWDSTGYTASFDTKAGEWQSIPVPFASLVPVFRARTQPDAAPFNPRSVTSLQLMLSKFEYDGALNPAFKEGAFELPVASIQAYSQGE